mgnify:CR=1 FL=1
MSELEYTDEMAAADVPATMESVTIVETVRAVYLETKVIL